MHPFHRTIPVLLVAATTLIAAPMALAHEFKPLPHRTPVCADTTKRMPVAPALHNKHCTPPPVDQPPVGPPPVVDPPPPPVPQCDPALPSPLLDSAQAGPYTVTKTGAASLAVAKPDGGLSGGTELDINVGGTAYGFTKGAVVPWFQLPWTDTEVRVENWEFFGTKPITAVQVYQYPSPGPLFGGWQQLDMPIVMGSPQPDCIVP